MTKPLRPPETTGSRLGVWLTILHIGAVVVSLAILGSGTTRPEKVFPAERWERIPPDWTPPPVMVISCLAGVGLLALAPWEPAVALFVFAPLAYAFPRVAFNFEFFLRWHLMEFVAALGALGYAAWAARTGRRPTFQSRWLFWLMAALIAWIGVTTVVAEARGDFEPAINHCPLLMVDALAVFLLAAESLKKTRNWTILCLLFAATMSLRCLLAPQHIKGNGDLGVLLSTTIPLALLAAVSARSWLPRVAGLALASVVSALLFATTNRGGAVAIAAAMVVCWLMCRRKLVVLAAALPLLVMGGVAFSRTAYWQRFEDIWTGGSARSTVESRFDLMIGGWNIAREYPLFGIGLGNFEHRAAAFTPSGQTDSPHNNLTGMLAETGWPGAILHTATFFLALGISLRSARLAGNFRDRWTAIFLGASLVAYMVGACFMTRHTMALAFLLAGGTLALPMPDRPRSAPEAME